MKIINKQYHASFEDAIADNGNIYFTDWDLPVLYCFDGKEVKEVCVLPENIVLRSIGCLCKVENLVYLGVLKGEECIYTFDTENKRLDVLKMPFDIRTMGIPRFRFFNVHCYAEKIFFLGGCFPGILVVEHQTNKVFVWDEWITEVREKVKKSEGKGFFRKTMSVDNKIYAPMCDCNVVLEFDMENMQYQIWEIGNSSCSYAAICFDGKDFWLAPRKDGPIIQWNKRKGMINVYDEYPQDYIAGEGGAANIVSLRRGVLLFPVSGNMVLYIDKESGKISEFDSVFRECGMVDVADAGDEYLVCAQKICKRNICCTYMINKQTGVVTEYPIIYNLYDKKNFMYEYQMLNNMIDNDGRILLENYSEELNDFIAYVKNRD